MAVNKIDGIIQGLSLIQSLHPDPDIKFKGYIIQLPGLTEEDFSEEDIETLRSYGWYQSPIKTVDGPVEGFVGYMFAGEI